MSRTADGLAERGRMEGGKEGRRSPATLPPSWPLSLPSLLFSCTTKERSSPLSFPVHAPNPDSFLSSLRAPTGNGPLLRYSNERPAAEHPPPSLSRPLAFWALRATAAISVQTRAKISPIDVTCPLSDKNCTEVAQLAHYTVSKSGSL